MNKPPHNYRARVRAILDVALVRVEELFGSRYQAPTKEQTERLIDCFVHVCNWGLDGARRLGHSAAYYQHPFLTESQLTSIERALGLRKKQPRPTDQKKDA